MYIPMVVLTAGYLLVIIIIFSTQSTSHSPILLYLHTRSCWMFYMKIVLNFYIVIPFLKICSLPKQWKRHSTSTMRGRKKEIRSIGTSLWQTIACGNFWILNQTCKPSDSPCHHPKCSYQPRLPIGICQKVRQTSSQNFLMSVKNPFQFEHLKQLPLPVCSLFLLQLFTNVCKSTILKTTSENTRHTTIFERWQTISHHSKIVWPSFPNLCGRNICQQKCCCFSHYR